LKSSLICLWSVMMMAVRSGPRVNHDAMEGLRALPFLRRPSNFHQLLTMSKNIVKIRVVTVSY
jgi:hypothetical protein